MTRPTRDRYYAQMLKLVASRSTCGRRAVGAIITSIEGYVLSTGYNGVPRGFPHCGEGKFSLEMTVWTCPGFSDEPGNTAQCWSVHAEQNALVQCGDVQRAHTIYVSCTPCFECAKLIANTPIRRVVVLEPYADARGAQVLRVAGIELTELIL